ncbi:Rrf2 family transcriptional regulator [Ferrigenium sp. UT5]|uniref:Rrf2 family transcriptional regulator n=1 Tax=Ferrigenium sp. UT5 TaxID=3242105 RepID=UPI003550CEFE
MRLTTKGRFAVTAMVDLTQRGGKGPITLAAISERQKISLSYLEQLFAKLRKNNIVASVRGPGGGYCLSRPASKISIAEIVLAVDEPLDATNCGRTGTCMDGKPCSTHELWMELSDRIYEYLHQVSLQQVANGQVKSEPSRTAAIVMSPRTIGAHVAA